MRGDDGNRTRVLDLEGRCTATVLHPLGAFGRAPRRGVGAHCRLVLSSVEAARSGIASRRRTTRCPGQTAGEATFTSTGTSRHSGRDSNPHLHLAGGQPLPPSLSSRSQSGTRTRNSSYVGMEGLEPPISWSQTRRPSHWPTFRVLRDSCSSSGICTSESARDSSDREAGGCSSDCSYGHRLRDLVRWVRVLRQGLPRPSHSARMLCLAL